MFIKINGKEYEYLLFKTGDHHSLYITIKGQLKTESNNINIVFGDVEMYGYKIFPKYDEKLDRTSFLVYIYQPGDPELREIKTYAY